MGPHPHVPTWEIFNPNRLYIPPTLYEKTKIFANELTDIANAFTTGYTKEKKGLDVDSTFWMDGYNKIRAEQDPIFSSLVKEFQRRLGVYDLPEE